MSKEKTCKCGTVGVEGVEFYSTYKGEKPLSRCKKCIVESSRQSMRRQRAACIEEFKPCLDSLRQDRRATRIAKWWEEGKLDKTQFRELIKYAIEKGSK